MAEKTGLKKSTDEDARQSSKYVIAMNAGEGKFSYVKNSSYQRGPLDVIKPIIEEEIAGKLDVDQVSSFWLADYGCSTGHNSFPAMQIIIKAIIEKSEKLSNQHAEFFMFFNDNITNDFNTLFKSASLVFEFDHHVIGLPGSFRDRLLPKSSLHFGYSSFSLHWLSEIPKELIDPKSLAWNKGAICPGSKKEVGEAYLRQYKKDLGSFLDARAHELKSGGMLALLVPCNPTSWDPQTEFTGDSCIELVGSCLVDMANEGIIHPNKVDEFNVPYYFATPEELKDIIGNNNKYCIERFEIVDNPRKDIFLSVTDRVGSCRAALEKLIEDHFGSGIIDKLFDRYMTKLVASTVLQNSANDKTLLTLVVLKLKDEQQYLPF